MESKMDQRKWSERLRDVSLRSRQRWEWDDGLTQCTRAEDLPQAHTGSVSEWAFSHTLSSVRTVPSTFTYFCIWITRKFFIDRWVLPYKYIQRNSKHRRQRKSAVFRVRKLIWVLLASELEELTLCKFLRSVNENNSTTLWITDKVI